MGNQDKTWMILNAKFGHSAALVSFIRNCYQPAPSSIKWCGVGCYRQLIIKYFDWCQFIWLIFTNYPIVLDMLLNRIKTRLLIEKAETYFWVVD